MTSCSLRLERVIVTKRTLVVQRAVGFKANAASFCSGFSRLPSHQSIAGIERLLIGGAYNHA